jgi:hypothetical protein
MTYVSRADAVVALRSFGRRFSDVISGPVGDDAWERLVRTVGPEGLSAMGFVFTAAAELSSLAVALAALPSTFSVSFPAVPSAEPSGSVTIAELQAQVKAAAGSAADALDARRDEDYETAVQTSSKATTVGAHISEMVTRLAASIRHAEAATQQ